MREKLDELRKDLEELEKTPMFMKPARAEQTVRKSFELVSELAQCVDQLRFRLDALEGLEQRMADAAVDAESLDDGTA